MNVIIGLLELDTSDLIFPRHYKIKELLKKLDELGYTITSENHIALCILIAKIRDYKKVTAVRYEKDRIVISADKEIYLDYNAVYELARGIKRFIIDENLRFHAKRLANGLLSKEKIILFVNSRPPMSDAPMIVLTDIGLIHKRKYTNSLREFADKIVLLDDFLKDVEKHIHTAISQKKELDKYNTSTLFEKSFLPTESYYKSNFPKHSLMLALKSIVKNRVKELSEEYSWKLDKLDLEYQTLFRLTTFEFSELITDSNIVSYKSEGLINDSLLIRYYNQYKYSTANINCELVDIIIKEQALVILDRLSRSKLPVDLFMSLASISEESRSVLYKDRDWNEFIAKNRSSKDRKVSFREVPVNIARDIHNDLHYIHTPRADLAFGLFYENEELPFSVVALERIDRLYKKQALALFGYDVENCLDFTRLYSRPGGPKNASSILFKCLRNTFKNIMPNIQAGISTHMPTYTHGHSMLAGGFDTPFLLKDNVHTFLPKIINGKKCYEMFTNRRVDSEAVDTDIMLRTKMPMLPVVELIAPFRKPRIKPVFELDKTMLILKHK